MRYLDVCAGISASTVAWKPLGWEAAAYSEIEPAPRAVLAHHYPSVPIHGDFTTIRGDEYGTIDLLVGGTPCQDFSVAGLRAGLDGDRGKLSLEFLRLSDRARPRWVVWENVPGVLSQDGGRAFGAILGGLGEIGYGFAYRVLDARYFNCPGQRARVFVVGCVGDSRAAAATLLERSSLGPVAPARLSRSDIHGCFSRGIGSRLNLDGSLTLIPTDQGYRFVSPLEGERIMGFPDNYTLVPFKGRMMSDRARYEALGNSMHTGVMRWIGERIQMVEAIKQDRLAA